MLMLGPESADWGHDLGTRGLLPVQGNSTPSASGGAPAPETERAELWAHRIQDALDLPWRGRQ